MSLNIFLYLSLAAWRLASLLANEDGPWMIFKRFRQRAEQWCHSIWIGVGLTALYLWMGETIFYLALPFALSTVAIIIKYVVQLLQTAQQFLDNMDRSQK
jgi:heme exporter protein D